jgi:hypothetical protein
MRFTQPDSLIPNIYAPQNLNRFSYVLNNPVNFNDPTGHMACSDAYDFCGKMVFDGKVTTSILRRALHEYGVKLSGNWDSKDASAIYFGVRIVGEKLVETRGTGESAGEAFRNVFNGYTFTLDSTKEGKTDDGKPYFCERFAGSGTKCYKNSINNITSRLIVHEIAHVFNATIGNNGYTTPYSDLGNEGIFANVDGENVLVAGFQGGIYQRTSLGYRGPQYQEDRYASPGEDFADTFMNWVYGTFSSDVYGGARNGWIQGHISTWMDHAITP